MGSIMKLPPPSPPLPPQVDDETRRINAETDNAYGRDSCGRGGVVAPSTDAPSSSRRAELAYAVLSVGAEVCDGIYYFLDNLLWLHKSGAIKSLRFGDERKYEVRAAVAELVGYMCFEVPRQLMNRSRLKKELLLLEWKLIKDGDSRRDDADRGIARQGVGAHAALLERIEATKFKQLLCTLVLVKVTADGLLAFDTLLGA